MSHIFKHIWVLEESYNLLLPSLDGRYFPSYEQIKKHEGLLGPDILHSVKFLTGKWGYQKMNHMNAEVFSGSLDMSEKYYPRLVAKLKTSKDGGKEAAWLAHFVIDALEPTHLTDWRVGKNQRLKQKKHSSIERLTKNVRNNKKIKPIKISGSIEDYLVDVSGYIKSLNVSKLSKKLTFFLTCF